MATNAAAGHAYRPLRLPRIVALLRIQPLPIERLLPALNRQLRADRIPEISLRTLQHDVAWMLDRLGKAGIEKVRRSRLHPAPPPEFHRYRWFYRLVGAEDLLPMTSELVFLTELEALALYAARAQLSSPPAPGAKAAATAGQGPLADALSSLIQRLGLGERDARIPDVLAVTQVAPQPYDPAHLLAILRALRLGDAVEMQYRPLDKPAHAVTAQPIRIVLVEGEPYLWAWDGAGRKVKSYKLSRIEALARRDGLPGVPRGLDAEVRATVKAGFKGVSGSAPRCQVQLLIRPAGIPHLRHRLLGSSQDWEDLPDGSARMRFRTSGIQALRHWLLQYGAAVVVEAPAELREWMRAETGRMAGVYA